MGCEGFEAGAGLGLCPLDSWMLFLVSRTIICEWPGLNASAVDGIAVSFRLVVLLVPACSSALTARLIS